MASQVLLTQDAASDLEELYNYIKQHDSPNKADYVLDKITETFASLAELPERGAQPKELLALGIHEYREIYFKPYRIVYRHQHDKVYILLIVDGRRDMQAVLQRRLLKA